ncbi:ABC-2 type transport system permease protein [Natranaerovirga hydrolytica]|uniref:ABC-2 type transport system permease protein n=1 Tax=Natranaerovirga hydrolytica TaxID=680378 RepID=A0A4R1MJV7_9FIRM|nr:ABC transporter permease [Natranaerovirga hydrolytica]TCK90609.1 ABC-2 type transport system permease protein [Natranaerovirga hydrolytica]
MISYAFFKKELKELIKTHRFLVITVLFIFFAIVSPVTARYINEIIINFGDLDITLPSPVFTDAYTQFFSNNTINVIILIILTSGTVVSEKSKGSIMLILSKGLERRKLLLTKTLVYCTFFTFVYWLSVCITYLYTYLLFEEAYTPALLISFGTTWLYGLFLIVVAILMSVISYSFSMAAGLTFGAYIVFNIIASVPYINKYSPAYLSNISNELYLQGTSNDLLTTVFSSLLLITIFLIISVKVFKNQEF